jgi:hypothetical protein
LPRSTGGACGTVISWSGSDAVSALSYEKETEVARIDVGDLPQRIRSGNVRTDRVNSQ